MSSSREPSELMRVGDKLQSEASRLAEWAEGHEMPYEVLMARLEVVHAVDAWTSLRSRPAAVPDPLRATVAAAKTVAVLHDTPWEEASEDERAEFYQTACAVIESYLAALGHGEVPGV